MARYRAKWLLSHGKRCCRRRDDPDTIRAVSYLRARARCPHQLTSKVTGTFADILAAHQLYEAGSAVRWEVEARLLARQTPEEIAARTSLTPGAIRTFEALFFNVSDRIEARDWVTVEAVGWWRDAVNGRDHATLLRGYAYHGGVYALEGVLPYLTGQKDLNGELPDPTTPEGQVELTIRMDIALAMLPYNQSVDEKFLRLYPDLIAASRKAPRARPVEELWAERATEALKALEELATKTRSPAAEEDSKAATDEVLAQNLKTA